MPPLFFDRDRDHGYGELEGSRSRTSDCMCFVGLICCKVNKAHKTRLFADATSSLCPTMTTSGLFDAQLVDMWQNTACWRIKGEEAMVVHPT